MGARVVTLRKHDLCRLTLKSGRGVRLMAQGGSAATDYR